MVEHFRQGADVGAALDGLVLSARILAEATICIALVIWDVFLTDLIRRLISLRLPMCQYSRNR